ncbi:hypothetical protein ACFQ8C_03120 [Streptomyces sp. NPDC056503]
MTSTGSDRPATGFPRGVGAPATRALVAAGHTRLGCTAPGRAN